ncbi:glycerol kinase GlpK [Aeromicrobium duanguangcaii]|uniref:Glycerol kinase n=1 Tax=Aeromicrobium duanguangcaii TaxID=2968086 RepID=A0ABY5KFS1_9ACTN|nr:glycerol kinase GlpK [Aeromicrobium duanguangcaii]MCD9153598.1 glycerol kinase GlpK [Aeromicrobium duanguangcaii]UUI69319.1 glycerol kinase GlpK [Aeromicrobium duanguangcaii]
MSQEFVGAIDQGTTSTRFMVFDHAGDEVGRHQVEHEQMLPQAGWVEHDAAEIWTNTRTVIEKGLEDAGIAASDLAAVGITNQRETTVVWDRRTGEPYGHAIVWQDTRTAALAKAIEDDGRGAIVHAKSGLPPAAYFAGGKLHWILENVDGVRADAEAGHALFGTIDTWLIWNLTGGPDGGVHVTDVTNASRTMLMNIEDLQWDDELLEIFEIPRQMLPEITSSSEEFARTPADGPFGAEVILAGNLGDQHAALVGQACFEPGMLKNTYGTGNFLVLNTGTEIVRSDRGLLTTVAYRFGDAPPVYALEGSIAVTGSAIQWLRDQLKVFAEAADSESLAETVDDNGGVYFVPAFSGLFAPYWRPDARGVIVGLSRFNTVAHVARAALEAICYQSKDVVDVMIADSGIELEVLRVDGGITANELCMQIQADILDIGVSRPVVAETTALGAAYAAGLAVGFWAGTDELVANWSESKRWTPQWSDEDREAGYHQWKKAVERTLGWVE